MDSRNVTLTLPEPLLKRFRVYAAEQDTSMSALMSQAIQQMVDQDSGRREAATRLIQRMRAAADLGTGGVPSWTRDELHER